MAAVHRTSGGKAGGGNGKKTRAVSPGRNGKISPEIGDVNLLRYFRDITGYELLDSESELQIARRIVELEVAEWRACLVHPPIAAAVVEAVGRVHPDLRRRLAPVKRAHGLFRGCRGRFSTRQRDRYLATVEPIALQIKKADQDREVLEEIEAWILGRSEPSGILPPLRSSRTLEEIRTELIDLRSEGRGLRERFITSNLRLVISVAKRQRKGTLSLNDLIQEGNIGLMKAVQRFDPETGYRFSTYAIWWIRHAITRALADKSRTVRLPVHLVEAHRKLERIRTRFMLRTGREPTDKELACELGVSMRKLQRLQRQSPDPSFSLDREISPDTPHRYIDTVQDDRTPTPLEQVARNDWLEEIKAVIEKLPEIEAQIVRWRYGVGMDGEMTLKQIGDRYRLSRERIRQLQQQALWRMRQNVKGLY